VIGIEDYPFIEAEPLRGCRNDAERIAALLVERFLFPRSQVRLLLDRDATRDGILDALEDLRRSVGPDEQVLIHYSGHGSQFEEDGVQRETVVPHDSGRGSHESRDILDLEIRDRLAEITRVTTAVTLIFDSCHSGSIARRRGAERWVMPDRRPRGSLGCGTAPLRGSESAPKGPSGWLPESERYVLFAACRAEESARELRDPETGSYYGAFTFHLSRELIAGAGRGTTHRELFERAATRVTLAHPQQHPQLEGAWDRELFGRNWRPPAFYLPVGERQGSEVRLGGGTVHGVVVGSEWDVYPAGTREAGGAAARGRIRIARLEAAAATAEIVAEEPSGAVAAGTRAFEASRPAPAFRFRVHLPGEASLAREDLAVSIGRSPLLEPIRDGGDADRHVTVHLLPPRSGDAASAAPAPQLGALPGATWVVLDAADRLCMRPLPADEPDALDRLVRNLETLARHRALLELRPPVPERDELAARLEIDLHAFVDGRRVEARGARLELREGDGLGLTARHVHPEPLHVAILDLGLTGSVTLLHPMRGAVEALAPGRELVLGATADRAPRVSVPEVLPFPGETFESGRETLLFFASTREADLGLLTQGGVRSVSGPASPALAHYLRRALHGSAVRSAPPPVDPAAQEPWTVVQRSFDVRRRPPDEPLSGG
jgi:hypothetical protein